MYVCNNLVTQFKHTSASPKNRSSIFSAISIQLNWNTVWVSNVLFWSLSLCMFETNNVYNFLQIELKLEQIHLDHLYTGFLWSWMQACWLHLVQTERKEKKIEKKNLSVSWNKNQPGNMNPCELKIFRERTLYFTEITKMVSKNFPC